MNGIMQLEKGDLFLQERRWKTLIMLAQGAEQYEENNNVS